MESILSLFSYNFLIRAMIVGSLVSLCSALLGVILVLKRYSMIGDGLSHVGFGALAIAMVLNLAPLVVAVPVVIIAAVILLRISNNGHLNGDAALAVISTSALAIGIMAISLSKGINSDVYGYMFGSILAMTDADVFFSIALSLVVLVLFLCYYHKVFAVTFDESFARAVGLHADFYNLLIAVLTAVTIVLGMRMMGALLISALVIFPALSAMSICNRFSHVMLVAAVISLVCFIVGLVISYLYAAPTGASVVIIHVIVLLCCFIIGKIRRRAS